MTRPVILLEFNEIVPQLIDRHIAENRLPNFAAFKKRSNVFVTTADENEAPNLEPWIQWYSIHTGLPFKEHGVFRLTDGLHQTHDDIWRILLKHNKRVINMSSMNARSFGEVENSVYLPDPWCSSETPHPRELTKFTDYVSHIVQEYTNKGTNATALATRFMTLMASHGLSFSTAQTISKQLLGEKLNSSKAYWQRAPLLDALQFDLFRHYYKKNSPDFATFFVNSTAHYQHAYWRDMDPSIFGEEQSTASPYKDAILYGYECMDKLLGHFFKLERETGALLILSSALSQQPFLRPPDAKNTYYRFQDMHKFLADANIDCISVEPVMTNQYRLHFSSDTDTQSAMKLFDSIMQDGRQVLEYQNDHKQQLYVGIGLHDSVAESSVVTFSESGKSCRFDELFYALDATKSGRHHPDGVLWFKTGDHKKHENSPSILDILPTVLDIQGIPSSEYDHLSGRSLKSDITPF